MRVWTLLSREEARLLHFKGMRPTQFQPFVAIRQCRPNFVSVSGFLREAWSLYFFMKTPEFEMLAHDLKIDKLSVSSACISAQSRATLIGNLSFWLYCVWAYLSLGHMYVCSCVCVWIVCCHHNNYLVGTEEKEEVSYAVGRVFKPLVSGWEILEDVSLEGTAINGMHQARWVISEFANMFLCN